MCNNMCAIAHLDGLPVELLLRVEAVCKAGLGLHLDAKSRQFTLPERSRSYIRITTELDLQQI